MPGPHSRRLYRQGDPYGHRRRISVERRETVPHRQRLSPAIQETGATPGRPRQQGNKPRLCLSLSPADPKPPSKTETLPCTSAAPTADLRTEEPNPPASELPETAWCGSSF